MEPAFGQYLKQFTGLSGGRDAGAKVFLLRNFPGGREPDPEAAAEAAQRDAQLINGLECKLSCSTSKARRGSLDHKIEHMAPYALQGLSPSVCISTGATLPYCLWKTVPRPGRRQAVRPPPANTSQPNAIYCAEDAIRCAYAMCRTPGLLLQH